MASPSSASVLTAQGRIGGSETSSFTSEDLNSSSPCNVIIDPVTIEHFPLSFDVNVDNMFTSKKKIVNILRMIAIRRNYKFKVTRSDPSRLYVNCRDVGCTWNLKSYLLNDGSNLWRIKSYQNIHSCVRTMTSSDHRQANSALVSECLRSTFVDEGEIESIAPTEIVNKMRNEFKVNVTYYTALRAKKLTLNSMQGSAEESYAKLPKYAECLKNANPGTYTAIALDDDGHFKYFFLSFGLSINGWMHCRPVISVERTSLKNKYSGILLMAAAMDGDNNIFPIAFSIVDSENDNSWLWFFEHLKNAIGEREDLVIISDCYASISKAVSSVYPEAQQCFCTQLLYRNLHNHFNKGSFESIFNNCARAYTKVEFDSYMDSLSRIDQGIKPYLLNVDPTKWARSHSARRRYNIMTTNISECLYSVLEEAMERPIIPLVEAYRKLCQKWFYERRISGSKMQRRLTSCAEVKNDSQRELAQTLSVDCIQENEFEVTETRAQYVVNINHRTCTCNVWQSDDFPCPHAMASLWKINRDPKEYVSKLYTADEYVATYVGGIYPPCDYNAFSDELSEESINTLSVSDTLPPEVRRLAGRPKKKRIPSIGERFKKSVYCGECGKSGHNKRSCTNKLLI